MAVFRPVSLAPSLIQEAWLKLMKRLQELTFTISTTTGLSTIVYVDQARGNDATGVRGSVALPFATIQAGYAAAQAGDTILVAPGTYVEDVVFQDKEGLTLQGSGPLSTVIQGSFTCFPVAPANVQDLEVRDLTIQANDPVQNAINVDFDGQAAALNFQTGVLRLINLDVTNVGAARDYQIGNIGNVYCERLTGGELQLNEVGQGSARDCTLTDLQVRYNINEVPLPNGAADPGPITFVKCRFTGDAVLGEGAMSIHSAMFDASCVVEGDVTSLLSDDAAFTVSGRNLFRGTIEGDLTVVHRFADAGADHYGIDFDHSVIRGAVVVEDTDNSGQTCLATFRNASLLGTVESGDYCQMDIRGGCYDDAGLSSSGANQAGTVDRSESRYEVPAGGASPYTFAVPFSTANYTVTSEVGNAGDAPVVIAAKASTGANVTPAAANATVDIVVTMVTP